MKRESLYSILKIDYSEIDSQAKIRIKNSFYNENYSKLRISALIILVGQLLFIVRDSFAGFFAAHSLNRINLIAEIITAAISFGFFIYSSSNHSEWCSGKLCRILYRLYIILMTISVFCYMFTDMFVRHTAFGICLCLLFIPIIAPFYDLFSQTALFIFITVFSTVAYLWCFKEDPLGVFGVVFMPLLLYLTSCFLRSYFIKTLISREKTKSLTNELIYRNKTDFLTDVSTRMCLYDDYNNAKCNGQTIGVVLYDIDDFKKYNDTFSHIAGDKCLKKTSQAIKSFAGENKGKVYRYGGEEFIVMFFDISKERFNAIVPEINRIVYDLKLEHSKTAIHKYVTVSVGGTYCNDLS